MSTSPFSVLSYLKGWEYKSFPFSAICKNGDRPQETTITAFGWLSNILLTASDCFATLTVTPLHLNQSPGVAIFPDFAKQLGFVQPSPGGLLMKYYRPDLSSSWGVYVLVIQPGVEAGPFAAPTKVQLNLPSQSTQSSALISAVATAVQLTDMDLFMKSLADLPVNKNADLTDAIRSLVKTLEARK